jgi:hypothetical protein
MTAANQLKLLTDALAPVTQHAFSAKFPTTITDIMGKEVSGTQNVQNQAIDALNKIVINTFAIAQNTWELTSGTVGHSGALTGLLASGGWIRGGTPGVDSVPILAMQDEFMVNASATRALTQQYGAGVMDLINTGRVPATIDFSSAPSAPPITNVVHFPRGGGGGSNAELIAEVKALKEEVKKLREENTKVTIGTSNQQTRAIGQIGEDIGEGIDKGARRIADQSRMNAQMAKQRGR